jgi:hypothetical protein
VPTAHFEVPDRVERADPIEHPAQGFYFEAPGRDERADLADHIERPVHGSYFEIPDRVARAERAELSRGGE